MAHDAGEFIAGERVYLLRSWRVEPGSRGTENATVICGWKGAVPPSGTRGLLTLRFDDNPNRGFFNLPAVAGHHGELVRGAL